MSPRVLLVEDDPFAQELVTAILLSAGIETDIAPDGFVALQRMQARTYAIALVDYHLPEMDGYALAKLLRDAAAARGDAFQLVGLTADRNGLAARRGADTLFDAIVVKPFEPQRLIDIVRAALRDDVSILVHSREAAHALLAAPDRDCAQAAARAFWRMRSVDQLPKILVLPDPSPAQISDLSLCFEIVDAATAELVMLLDVHGLAMLMQMKTDGSHRLPPVVTLDPALAPVADVVFEVADPRSWSEVATRFNAFWTPASHSGDDDVAMQVDADLAIHHDRATLLKVSSLFGGERTQMLLSEFANTLTRSFVVENPDEDAQMLSEQLRSIVSTAGTLGFARLAETCRDLSAAMRAGDDLARPLGKLKAAKLRSLRTLSQIREFGLTG